MEKKLENISAIKTIMMILVVLYHSMIFFGNNWITFATPKDNAPIIYQIALWLNTVHIQTFCMASGFLFYYLKIEKGKYMDVKSDIKKRGKRLLVPYIFCCIFWVIPIAIYFNKYSLAEITKKYILMESPNQLWFLIMLFSVFVFFEILGKKIKLTFKNLIYIYIICTCTSCILQYIDINYFQIARTTQYILYFYLGGYIYKIKDKITIKQTCIMIILAFLLYGTYIYCNTLESKLPRYMFKLFLPLVSVLQVSSSYYLITLLVKKNIIHVKNKFFKLLEENSFGIYLFHQQIIYFTIVLLNGRVIPIIQVISSFVISLILSLIISIILKKNKITKYMFGL